MKLERNSKIVFRASIEKKKFTFKGPEIRLTVDFSSVAVEVRMSSAKNWRSSTANQEFCT